MNKEKAQFTVRMHPETGKKLAYIADYYGRSVNREIDWLVKKEISAFEKENGKIDLEAIENRD